MPQCDNCGAHVFPAFKRARSDNDGVLHGCPECTSPATRARDCAGVDSDYQQRTGPDGRTIVTDGGRDTFECDDCGDETLTDQRWRYRPPGQSDFEVDFADLCPLCSTSKDSTRLFRPADDQEGR
jgi:hypothetical protein